MLKKPVVYFLVFAFLFSWAIALVAYAAGYSYGSAAGFAAVIFFMFGPLLSAIITNKWILKKSWKEILGTHWIFNNYVIIAWMLPLLWFVLTILINKTFPGVIISFDIDTILSDLEYNIPADQLETMKEQLKSLPVNPLLLMIPQVLIAGATVNAVATFGEEAGWRGFLYDQLKEFSFIKQSLFVGAFWGIWHAPIILQGHNYAQHPTAGVVVMILFTIALSPVFLYFRIKSGTILSSAFLHGTINAIGGIFMFLIIGKGNDLIDGFTGLAGLLGLVVLNIALFVYDYFISNEKLMLK